MDQPQLNSQNEMFLAARQSWLYIVTGAVLLIALGAGTWQYFLYETPRQESKKEIAPQDQTVGWKTYRNEDYGFEIKVPPSWSSYTVVKEVSPAGSEFVYGSRKKSQFPWATYRLGIKGENLGPQYFTDQVYGLLTIFVFENSDVPELGVVSEVENTFNYYKLVPTDKKYFVLIQPMCQDCDVEDPFTGLRESIQVVMDTFRYLPDKTADWKTYRNEKYGFELRYPDDWEVLSNEYPGSTYLNLIFAATKAIQENKTPTAYFEQFRLNIDDPWQDYTRNISSAFYIEDSKEITGWKFRAIDSTLGLGQKRVFVSCWFDPEDPKVFEICNQILLSIRY